jgi:hypothetical protein
VVETIAQTLNFHTCIVRMRRGVYASFNKISLTAECNVFFVKLAFWLIHLLLCNNRLLTTMQDCLGAQKVLKGDKRLSERIAHGRARRGV